MSRSFWTRVNVMHRMLYLNGIVYRVLIIYLPFGIAVAGSFRSPDKFAPATIPVTAGKNTPKSVKKEESSSEAFTS